MWKIQIDSTKRREAIVALFKVTGGIETLVASKEGDLDIVSAIKELLTENNLKLADVSEVKPVLGPGSYTGLRNGVTVANTLSWALGKKELKDLDVPLYGSEPNISERKEKSLN